MNFDLGVPARAAWSALSNEGWSLGIGGLPLVALLPCKGVLGGRVGGFVVVVTMTPFVIWAGGSGSISGKIGRLLGTGGNGEGCDELGAVISVLPEGELELDFERPNLEGVCGWKCGWCECIYSECECIYSEEFGPCAKG